MSLIGGMPPIRLAWRLEIPLLLCMYFYFNAITRPSKWQSLVTAIPIVLVYGIFEANFKALKKLVLKKDYEEAYMTIMSNAMK